MNTTKSIKAESRKNFKKPAILFMTACISFALIVLSIIFSPVLRHNNSVNFYNEYATVNEIFNAYNANEMGNMTKYSFDYSLNKAVNKINNFNSVDLLQTLKNKVEDLQNFLTQTGGMGFYPLLLNFTNNPNNESARYNFINALINLEDQVLDINDFLTNDITQENINFYITYGQFAEIKTFFFNFSNFIPNQSILINMYSSQLIEIGEKIVFDFSVTAKLNQIKALNPIQFDSEFMNEIIENYFNDIVYGSGSDTLLSLKYNEIQNFVNENASSSDADDISAIYRTMTEYKNIALIATQILTDSFNLAKAGNYSDKQLSTFVGFENINKYALNENLALNKYLFENQIFDGNYLVNFSLSSTVGYQVSAYDFCFFSMQIISIIIVIFAIFLIISGIKKEQYAEFQTLNFFDKNKIIRENTISNINSILAMLMISIIASFILGVVLYGLVPGNILFIFNASLVVPVYPGFAILIYLVCLVLFIAFFISLATLFANIFKSGIVAFISAFFILFCAVILNAFCSLTGFYSILPFAHLDLFKYFGNAEMPSELFGVNMILDGNFYFSFIYVILLISIINFIAKLIYNKKNKD